MAMGEVKVGRAQRRMVARIGEGIEVYCSTLRMFLGSKAEGNPDQNDL